MAKSGLSSDFIEIHFDVHEPVELTELTLAFQGLGRDYRRFLRDRVRSEGGKINDDDIKLYITKIESNCILAHLAGASQIVGAYFTLLDYQNIFIDYIKHFDVLTTYFKNLSKLKDVKAADIECTKAGAQAVEALMALVARNRKGKFALRARAGSETSTGSKVYAEIELTSDEAAQVQRGALIAQKVLDYRGEADHKNVLMYFQRTSTDEPKGEGKTDDKAIIQSISTEPLPVHFASQLDQARITDLKNDPRSNPFKAAYRVDVNVESDRKGIPRFYRVIHLHEILPEDDDE